MDALRLKIVMTKPNFHIPIGYNALLQGLIYSLIAKSHLGHQYHDIGFQYANKTFKCFVFSQLFGKFKVHQQELIFENEFYFYLSSQDEDFLKEIYRMLMLNETVVLNHQKVTIAAINLFELTPFYETETVTLKTLSPVLIYSTKDDFSTYYALSSPIANHFMIQNLKDKSQAYGYPLKKLEFTIEDILYEKRRMVKFKDCVYPAYLGELKVNTNFETLLFVYNCGLSSKNSAGFGMIEMVK